MQVSPTTKVEEVTFFQVRIPDCCREGRADCPHVVQRIKAKKGNVGV